MKKFVVYFLLIAQMNMFLIPQVSEVDIYANSGKQIDDINSVFEFFNVMMGYDTTADDEDDDSGNDYQVPLTIDLVLPQVNNLTDFLRNKPTFRNSQKQKYPILSADRYGLIDLDIISPPPKA